MDFAKKLKISKYLIFLYLVLLPFGQLGRLHTNIGGYRVPIDASDIIVGLILLIFLSGGFKKPKIWGYIKNFLLIAFSSLIFSFFLFKSLEVLIGALYLLRLTAYFASFVVVFNIVKKERGFRENLLKSIIGVTSATAIFGWIQYFRYPDFRPLIEWGWDDHLYRIAGTFIDPAFISIIFVLGFLASLVYFLKSKEKKYLLISLFLLVTTLFTYARSGYLALIAGSFYLFYKKEKIKTFLIVLIAIAGLVLLLPRPAGEGVKLERVASIEARLGNYNETLEIVKSSPVIGVGYNNMCLARKEYLGQTDLLSHSCSGSDSSLLLVLATTGTVGLLIFTHLLYRVVISVKDNYYGRAFLAGGTALIVHSLFANSLFYPWVLGVILMLYAISIKE